MALCAWMSVYTVCVSECVCVCMHARACVCMCASELLESIMLGMFICLFCVCYASILEYNHVRTSYDRERSKFLIVFPSISDQTL